ncbi:unnamed protein product [Rhodiola kirilowii]
MQFSSLLLNLHRVVATTASPNRRRLLLGYAPSLVLYLPSTPSTIIYLHFAILILLPTKLCSFDRYYIELQIWTCAYGSGPVLMDLERVTKDNIIYGPLLNLRSGRRMGMVQETAIGTVNSTLQMKRRNLFKPQIHTVLATSLKPSTSITSCLERGEMKEELPHRAVLESKPQLVEIRDRVQSDVGGTLAAPSAQHQKGPVSPIQSEGKRVATAANPNPEDAADLLRMCLQCGIPKTFTTGKGMVYPVCNDRPPANPNKEAEKKKGSTIKDKEKNKRMKGQSSHASWKSETKMQLRQQFD